MSLLGLSPLTYALGAAGIAAALGAVHLLRIRLRRQTVDSLLFFEMLGAVERPRVLLGHPARWLSYLIALIALLALWTVFGEPAAIANRPSRIVLVDTSGLGRGKTEDSLRVMDSHLQTATEIAASFGLGPKGAVYAIGIEMTPLLRSGEPTDLLIERAARIDPLGPQLSWNDALHTLATGLTEGDQFVVLGAPSDLPATFAGHQVIRAGIGEARHTGLVGIALTDWPQRQLAVEFVGQGSISVTLVGDNEQSQNFTASAGTSQTATFTDFADTAQKLRLTIRDDHSAATIPFNLPLRQRHPVLVSIDSSGAVTPSIMADAALELANDGTAAAQVLEGDSESTSPLPTLRIQAGQTAQRRLPRSTEHNPLSLSLRDRERGSATALKPITGEEVWVEDSLSGAPLISSHILASGQAEIRVVDWLLEDPTHRDVPATLIGCLRLLAGVRNDKLVAAGEPIHSASIDSSAIQYNSNTASFSALPATGLARTRLATGTWRDGDALLAALPSVASAPPLKAKQATLGSLPGRTDWVLWLLCAALLCISADIWLYHRGRTP